MKYYIIGIGGSGHRCIEAFTHISAAGLVNCNEINMMFVDSDSGNGNFVERTKKTLEDYINVNSFLNNTETLFNTKLSPIGGINNCLWSPVDGNLESNNMEDSKKTLNNIFKYNTMNREEKIVFDFLYTDREKNKALVEGFYGHPSIGSLMMAYGLDFNAEPWCTFINNLKSDVKNDEVRVFLIASIFGGTGASGLPTISNYLTEKINNQNLKIGGFLLLPYFRFDSSKFDEVDKGLCPDSGNFMGKTKAALYFYDNQDYCNKYFKRIYVMGDSYEEYTEVTPALGNLEQKNKPHIIELMVGFAASHFFNETDIDLDKKVYITTRSKISDGATDKYIYEWDKIDDILGSGKDVKGLMSQQLRFAVAYTKHFYPIIENIANGQDSTNAYKSTTWYKNYFIDKKIDVREDSNEHVFNNLKKLYDYCSKYLDWIYDLHLIENTEKISKINPGLRLFNISDSSLFNKKFENNIGLGNFHNLVCGHEKNENKFSEIYHNISKKNRERNQQRKPVEQFILDLYRHSSLK